jgi:hypothetical protein
MDTTERTSAGLDAARKRGAQGSVGRHHPAAQSLDTHFALT